MKKKRSIEKQLEDLGFTVLDHFIRGLQHEITATVPGAKVKFTVKEKRPKVGEYIDFTEEKK
jgi:hypothetical protein